MEEDFMKELFYCYDCQERRETKIVDKELTFDVKGCPITLSVPVRVCTKCGGEDLDIDLDENILNRFYEEYRKQKHKMTT